VGHEIMVGDPAEAVERESRGLWGKTGQRSLERSGCLALLVRKPATKVRFWPIAGVRAAGSDVRFQGDCVAKLLLRRIANRDSVG
jgi:hypothetical protein